MGLLTVITKLLSGGYSEEKVLSKEAREREVTKVQMDLAMAKGTPLSRQLDKELQKMDFERQKREHARMREPYLAQQRQMYNDSVNYLYLHDQISHAEYKKFVLDETGEYRPKLKTDGSK